MCKRGRKAKKSLRNKAYYYNHHYLKSVAHITRHIPEKILKSFGALISENCEN